MSLESLQQLLQSRKNVLIWDFLKKNSNYDWDICEILWMQEDTCRYWDAVLTDIKIEFKKWRSIWLDLIRYSEILLKRNKEASIETITLFFIPNNDKTSIEEILGIRTLKLINRLWITEDMAVTLLDINEVMPRSLNAQASLTVSDIRNIADFIV